MTDFRVASKIKIVERSKQLSGARFRRAKRDDHAVSPYDMRVRRDLGGGLWQLEDTTGQLYLAVLSRPSSDAVRLVMANKRQRNVDSSSDEWVPSGT